MVTDMMQNQSYYQYHKSNTTSLLDIINNLCMHCATRP